LVWDEVLYEIYGVKKEDFSGAYEAGEPIRMSGLNWDITEKVLAEEALKDQISEMERINLLMVDREKKMIALKEEITKLK